MDNPCSTPQTPMAGVPMNGITGLFRCLIRTDQPESTKRALALMAGSTLCGSLIVLITAVWGQAIFVGTVDTGLNVALGIISGSVAALAGVAYRKQEPTSQEQA